MLNERELEKIRDQMHKQQYQKDFKQVPTTQCVCV